MARHLLYFLVSIFATTIGAMTGMGGGVIIKPVLDVFSHFDVETIGMLSSITVLTMSLVSVGKHIQLKTPINFTIAVPLAFGSIAGGYVGQYMLRATVNLLNLNRAILVIQNILLSALILLVYFYMLNKDKIKSFQLEGAIYTLLVGFFLGITSSFLGIGGGPINVAIFIYLFSFDMKEATVGSLVTILFAQISKIATVATSSGFGIFNFSMLPSMLIGAVAGGFLGSLLNKSLSETSVEKGFNLAQLMVLFIAITNIIRNLL